jgi:hypothetical protein
MKNKSNSKNDKNTLQWISTTKLNSINKNISPVKDKYPRLNSSPENTNFNKTKENRSVSPSKWISSTNKNSINRSVSPYILRTRSENKPKITMD